MITGVKHISLSLICVGLPSGGQSSSNADFLVPSFKHRTLLSLDTLQVIEVSSTYVVPTCCCRLGTKLTVISNIRSDNQSRAAAERRYIYIGKSRGTLKVHLPR